MSTAGPAPFYEAPARMPHAEHPMGREGRALQAGIGIFARLLSA